MLINKTDAGLGSFWEKDETRASGAGGVGSAGAGNSGDGERAKTERYDRLVEMEVGRVRCE